MDEKNNTNQTSEGNAAPEPVQNVPTASSLPQAPGPENAETAGANVATETPLPAPQAVPPTPEAQPAVPTVGAASIPAAPGADNGAASIPTATVENKKGIGYYLLILILFLLIFGSIGFAAYKFFLEQPPIESYADCVAAGNPVQDSNPPKCTTSDGRTFTQGQAGTGTGSETETEVTPTQEPVVEILKIHFSKDPESADDPTYTVAVERTPTVPGSSQDLQKNALTLLIAGPTAAEKATGLYSPIKLTGVSNCGGDFSLAYDETKKETTVKFCKPVDSAGALEDARIMQVIEKTIDAEFEDVEKVIILDRNGNCFGDQSGQDLCKS